MTSDSAGRISAYNGWTYGYDAVGRLVSACKSPTCASGFDKVTFAYDGEGHRTQMVETPLSGTSVSTTTFAYQGDAVIEEVTTVGAPVNSTTTRSFTLDGTGRIVTMTIPAGGSAGTYVVTWNGHGDAMALWRENADGSVTLANSFTYDTWGTPTRFLHNGVGNLGFRYVYVGVGDVQWDDSLGLGLQYMHSRHQDPTLGRFLQPDPARLKAGRYAYVVNNPISLVDPEGDVPGKPGMSIWHLISTKTGDDTSLLSTFIGVAGSIVCVGIGWAYVLAGAACSGTLTAVSVWRGTLRVHKVRQWRVWYSQSPGHAARFELRGGVSITETQPNGEQRIRYEWASSPSETSTWRFGYTQKSIDEWRQCYQMRDACGRLTDSWSQHSYIGAWSSHYYGKDWPRYYDGG